ncbi:MAG TPA: hypothetical protein VGR90_05805, partial [Acidimicrobiales bacterium]|nr:hypothetical protein [Acidimicrobiales bacterium]
MRRVSAAVVAVALGTAAWSAMAPMPAHAVVPAGWSPSLATGVDGQVNVSAAFGPYEFVAGQFDAAPGTPANSIAVYNTSTGAWAPLGPSTSTPGGGVLNNLYGKWYDGSVGALAVQTGSTNTLFVGGSFTQAGDTSNSADALPGLAAYSWTGSDPTTGSWGPAGIGTSGSQTPVTIGVSGYSPVSSLAVVGNDLYVGGQFSGVTGGTNANLPFDGIAMWDESAQAWDNLVEGTAIDPNGSWPGLSSGPFGQPVAQSITPAPGTNGVFVTGTFNTVGAVNGVDNLALWTGPGDRHWLPVGSPEPGAISAPTEPGQNTGWAGRTMVALGPLSVPSAEASATPVTSNASTASAPSAPSGVAASAAGSWPSGMVTVTWSPVPGATSYAVYDATASGGESTSNQPACTPAGNSSSGTTTSSGTACTVSGLTIGTPYFFTVVASNPSGSSGMSTEASATPQGRPTPSGANPPAPSGVTATAGDGLVTVSWSPVPAAQQYAVYATTTSGGEDYTTELPACTDNGNACVVTGLTDQTPYFFSVKAIYPLADGIAYSTGLGATPPNICAQNTTGG